MDQSRENIIEDSQDEIDIGELLRYLKTKWIVIVAVFLIGVIGAGVGTKCLITPKYTAVSKLYVVSASGKNIVNLDDLRLGTTLSSDYTELLKTRPICNEIISDLGLDYTVGQLKSMISIVPIEGYQTADSQRGKVQIRKKQKTLPILWQTRQLHIFRS